MGIFFNQLQELLQLGVSEQEIVRISKKGKEIEILMTNFGGLHHKESTKFVIHAF